MHSATEVRSLRPKSLKTKPKVKKPFKCRICRQSFQFETSLDYHTRTHRKQSDSSYECDVCKQTFRSSSSLDQHMKRHSKQMTYACGSCDKTFDCEHSLELHSNLHSQQRSDNKKYHCNSCLKSLGSRRIFWHHLEVCDGSKLFHCEHCTISFASAKELTFHELSHNMTCSKCDLVFGSFSVFLAHALQCKQDGTSTNHPLRDITIHQSHSTAQCKQGNSRESSVPSQSTDTDVGTPVNYPLHGIIIHQSQFADTAAENETNIPMDDKTSSVNKYETDFLDLKIDKPYLLNIKIEEIE